MKPTIEPTPTVATLSEHKFFVPAYQRGYRWTPEEVRDLLDDIRQFSVRVSGDSDEFYCLQPLVVRWLEDSGEWEVIDGQQRLTTIYLITHYINEMWRGRGKDPVFTLHYESRERTQEFLKHLSVKDDGSVDFNDANIDFAHISKAYQAIAQWVRNLGPRLNQDGFISAFRHKVRVLWYEPSDTDGVRIFTRINRGKIPLTNAELIRGLFLKSSNFTKLGSTTSDPHFARLQQMEISAEWDRLEANLHDDKFWYFLTDKEDPAETRIDLIFRLITGIEDKDSYALFREYVRHFPSNADVGSVLEKWGQVKACFQQVQDWYQDWELYHLIGYLIANRTPLRSLWEEAKGLRKSDFKAKLTTRIQKTLPNEPLDKLVYGQGAVKTVLLLHNVLTSMASQERHFRFPFNRVKSQNWDVEHIHSVSEKPPETEPHRREWLKDSASYLHGDSDTILNLKIDVATFLGKPTMVESEFDALYKRMLQSFSESGVPESINDLSNLALLDSGTNRGYGNAVFPVKRETIIDRERQGTFIPAATKNAFLKYYSKSVKEFTFWSKADRDAYLSAIQTTLDPFLNEATQ